MATAILRRTGFVGFLAERLLHTVADRLDVACTDPRLHQRALDTARTTVAQSQVVLSGSAFVAVSLDNEVNIGMLRQESDIRLNRTLLIRTNIRFVVIEVNVLDVLREQLLVAR